MKKLKDYVKLIFAAVVCFFMKFVPEKKAKKAVKAKASGNPIADTGRSGENDFLLIKEEIERSMQKSSSGVLKEVNREGQFHRDKELWKGRIRECGYINTG